MGALHKPNDATRAQVFALSSFGVNQDEIGGFLGLSDDTLRKHYSNELRKAKTERNADVAAFLFRSASGAALESGASYADCLKAAMFWMKTRAQWRETVQVDNTSSDGSMTPSFSAIEALNRKLDAIAERSATTGEADT